MLLWTKSKRFVIGISFRILRCKLSKTKTVHFDRVDVMIINLIGADLFSFSSWFSYVSCCLEEYPPLVDYWVFIFCWFFEYDCYYLFDQFILIFTRSFVIFDFNEILLAESGRFFICVFLSTSFWINTIILLFN